jgi:hypothetical protein
MIRTIHSTPSFPRSGVGTQAPTLCVTFRPLRDAKRPDVRPHAGAWEQGGWLL